MIRWTWSWFGARSRWAVILALFVVADLGLVILFSTGLEILSAARAYVGGEGLYSKAQKDAVGHLRDFAESQSDVDYQLYLAAIAVPLGDREARIEMEKAEPDLATVYTGLTQGGNNSSDLSRMVWLFRSFRRFGYMARAVDIWTAGDADVKLLQGAAERLRNEIGTGSPRPESISRSLSEIGEINSHLTTLEDSFSSTLGDAARWVQSVLMVVEGLGTAMLLGAGSFGAWRVMRHLSRSEADYRGLVDTAVDAVVAVDAGGRVVLFNPAAEVLFDQTAQTAIGRPLEELLVLPATTDLASPTSKEPRQLVGRHRDGTVFDAECGISRSNYAGSQGKTFIVRDITQRADEVLAAKAELMDRAEYQFVSMVSHELRTPMNGVIVMADLLMRTALEAKQREYAETIQQSGRALLRVIDDILSFSRLTAGKLAVDETELAVRVVLDELVALLNYGAREKATEIVSQVDRTVPYGVLGDAGRLRQVLLNLVGNAIKFTESGTVTVSADLVDATDGQVLLRFQVEDTGIGIQPDVQARLFQPFAQADQTAANRYGGTGLGLAICKQLVEQMGGRIGLQSTLGQGSTFWFELPFKPGGQNAMLGQAELRDLPVLVVTDASVRGAALSALLLAWGMRPSVVSPTSLLVDLDLRNRPGGSLAFDAVLIDLDDGLDEGLRAVQALAEPHSSAAALPVALMMAEADAASTPSDVTVLPRPLRSSQLFDWFLEWLGKRPVLVAHAPIVANGRITNCPRRPASVLQILVVEDAPLNQIVAQELLNALGYVPVMVASGAAALLALERGGFAAVLMDWRMPEMDGFEATRCIRAREAARGGGEHVPIIAMTAHAVGGGREQCLAAGMDDYVSKPVDVDQLRVTLGRWTSDFVPAEVPSAICTPLLALSPEILDPMALDKIRRLQRPGQPNLVGKVVDAFHETAPSYMVVIRQAVVDGDASSLLNAAHTLKGVAASVGMRRLEAVSSELEARGRSGDLAGTSVLLQTAQDALTLSLEALEQKTLRPM